MPKYLIDMPEHWGSGNCPHCQIQKCQHWRIGRVIVKKDCPLANAKEAVEVIVIRSGDGYYSHAITGRKETLYKVEEAK